MTFGLAVVVEVGDLHLYGAIEGIRTPNLLIRSRRPPVSLCFRWSLTVRFYAQMTSSSSLLCPNDRVSL